MRGSARISRDLIIHRAPKICKFLGPYTTLYNTLTIILHYTLYTTNYYIIGNVVFDTTKADGQYKKTASNAKLRSLLSASENEKYSNPPLQHQPPKVVCKKELFNEDTEKLQFRR